MPVLVPVLAALAVTESPGQIHQVSGVADRAFDYCAIDIYFEHMATILTANYIVPEMNTAPLNRKHPSLDN